MSVRKLTFWAIISLFAIATQGCIDDLFIRGNGNVISENRFTRPFNEVNSSGAFLVHITPGNHYEIVVNAESNLLPFIETDIRNGKLYIGTDGIRGINNTRPMEVFVVTPYLNAARLSGSGEITTDSFNTDHFEAMISGSGNIKAAVGALSATLAISGSGHLDILGHMRDAEMNISGSGSIYAYDLALANCKSVISGSGNMYVNSQRTLDVRISGSGNIFYLGNPSITASISGSGKIISDN